jgi:hypothetical protein
MNTVMILISCATNFGWPLHELDVKNAFLHEDLHMVYPLLEHQERYVGYG